MTDEAGPPKVPVVNDTRNPAVDLKTPRYLAYAIIAIVALILAGLFFKEIPTNNKELLATVVQTVLTVLIAAGGYFWGSSSGSRAKDAKP